MPPDESTTPPMSHSEWSTIRDAMTKIGVALESLSPEMAARVLASYAIIAGVPDRLVEILTGDA